MSDPLIIIAVGAVLGLVLGLLGGGGGILAVPVLVALGQPVHTATTMSLVIVGTGAAAALLPHHRAGRVHWRIGLMFGALGSVGAVLGSRLAVSASPRVILGGLVLLLIAGGVLMLRTAGRTRASTQTAPLAPLVQVGAVTSGRPITLEARDTGDLAPDRPRISRVRIVLLASAVGLVTGFFGVGAGFVVVPALVVAVALPIKRAAPTALVVIVANSAVALGARHDSLGPLSGSASLAAATAVFAVMGALLSRRAPGWLLSTGFGTLMLAVAAYTLARAVLLG